MKATPNVIKVKQDPANEIPAEIIASSIEEIAKGMAKLNGTRLTRKAITTLIHENSRKSGSSPRKRPLRVDSPNRHDSRFNRGVVKRLSCRLHKPKFRIRFPAPHPFTEYTRAC